MRPSLTRRAFLSGAAASAGGLALADSPLTALRPQARPGSAATPPAPPQPFAPGKRPVPRPSLDDLVRNARLGGDVSIALRDTATGEVRGQYQGDVEVPPASVTKTVTTLYALDTLGPAHRFATRVLATGALAGDTLTGDLILAGGGDPGLDTDGLGALVDELVAAGIRRVEGRFLVWDGALATFPQIEPSQPVHVSYNPAVGGLNVNYNRVHFEWARAGSEYDVTMQARAARYSPDVPAIGMEVIDRSVPVYTYAEGEASEEWTVARGALGTGGSRWLPIRHPWIYAGEVFQAICAYQGIVLPAPERAAAEPETALELARLESAELAEIARDMLYYSTNLTAEVLGLAASAARSLEPATLKVSAAMMNLWVRQRFGERVAFADHSGLSDESRVSALSLTAVLAHPAARESLRPLLKTHLMLDAQGNLMDPPPAVVQAKTGTLNFVSALAGYARTIGAADLSFATLTASHERRAETAGSEEETPPGARDWLARSRGLQEGALRLWGRSFSATPAERAALAELDHG
ncbi:D-alanyl-D-alanine carboxypeptidase/D-alanyl-D-alanine-endopeptidase [Pseudoroseicyclus sp. CXY001]|uniref:D-alanyl-D-alanine carboxypeptidase/D-alanyl-D-alanine endopeptidase n=1 Tax=Pseudoroseicyclus sp. CXY001 TaxID=3242492 RepID=UPI003570E22D